MRLPWRKEKTVPIRNPRIVDQNEDYAFRRSRTLTGSASSEISAATESRGRLKSTRLKEHELRSHRKKIGSYLLVSLIAFAGTAWLLSQFTWSVSGVASAVKPSLKDAAYVSLVDDYLRTRPLERFSFMLNGAELQSFIQQSRPEIKEARLVSSGFMQDDLEVVFRQPIIVWQMGGETYYVDEEGVAFKDNFYAEPALIVKDKSGIAPENNAVASSRILRFIGRVVTLVNESSGAKVSEVIMPLGMTREIDLKLRGRPYIIKTQLDRDPAGQAADVVSAVRFFEKKNKQPKYIDVRVSSQAFYRE